ncbi:glycosyltransferase, partial [Burkholderia cenocepacia]
DVDAFSLNAVKEEFYLTASRMVPYKKIDLIVEAFSRTPERKLVVIGDGPEMQKIRAKAGPNVEIMGYQPFAV